MKFTFTEKKMEASENLRAYTEKKAGKIDRLFRNESDAFVTFSTERGRFLVELTIKNNGTYFRAHELTSDMYASVDSAVATIERQIRKNKTRLAKKLREGADREVEALPVASFARVPPSTERVVVADAPSYSAAKPSVPPSWTWIALADDAPPLEWM